METILNPEFLVRKQDAFILDNLDLFARLCEKLKRHGSSVDVFKSLSEVQDLSGLPEIEKLFSMLKDVVFTKHCMLFSTEKTNTTVDSPPLRYLPHKFLPCTLDRARVTTTCDKLRNTINEHMGASLKLQEAQKEMLNIYKRVCNNDPNITGKHVYETYRKLNMARHKEQTLRETILQLSDKLTNAARAFVLNRLLRGVKALEHFCQIEHLPKKLLDEVRSVDIHQLATKIVKKCSVRYYFPDSENNTTTTKTPYQTYPVLRQCNNNSTDGHVLAGNYKALENKYVVALNTIKAKYSGQLALSLKKGQEVKQKMVSSDGQVAFGWTRWFKGAPKSYGFYPVNATTS